jgi:hypothetical protein
MAASAMRMRIHTAADHLQQLSTPIQTRTFRRLVKQRSCTCARCLSRVQLIHQYMHVHAAMVSAGFRYNWFTCLAYHVQ